MDYRQIGIFCHHNEDITALEVGSSITIDGLKITKKKSKKNDSCEKCGFHPSCDNINAGSDRCEGGDFIYKVEVK